MEPRKLLTEGFRYFFESGLSVFLLLLTAVLIAVAVFLWKVLL